MNSSTVLTSMPPRGIPKSFTPPLDFTVSSMSVTTFVDGILAYDLIVLLLGVRNGSYFLELNLFVTSGKATLGPMIDSTKPVASERMTRRIKRLSKAVRADLIALGKPPAIQRPSQDSSVGSQVPPEWCGDVRVTRYGLTIFKHELRLLLCSVAATTAADKDSGILE